MASRNAACSAGNTISTLDDPPVNEVGYYTAIATGADGLPVISYQDGQALTLKVAKCGNAACNGGWGARFMKVWSLITPED